MRRKLLAICTATLILTSCHKKQPQQTPPQSEHSNTEVTTTTLAELTTNLHLEITPAEVTIDKNTTDNIVSLHFNYPVQVDLNTAQVARDAASALNEHKDDFSNFKTIAFIWDIQGITVNTISFHPVKYLTPYTAENVFLRMGALDMLPNPPTLKTEYITVTSDKAPSTEFVKSKLVEIYKNVADDFDSVSLTWIAGSDYIYSGRIFDFKNFDKDAAAMQLLLPYTPTTPEVQIEVKTETDSCCSDTTSDCCKIETEDSCCE